MDTSRLLKEKEKKRKEIWIGLVELSNPAKSEILEGGIGAFSNFLVEANTIEMFKKKAAEKATSLGLELVEVQWAMPLEERLQKYDIDEELIEISKSLERDGEYATFHSWELRDG